MHQIHQESDDEHEEIHQELDEDDENEEDQDERIHLLHDALNNLRAENLKTKRMGILQLKDYFGEEIDVSEEEYVQVIRPLVTCLLEVEPLRCDALSVLHFVLCNSNCDFVTSDDIRCLLPYLCEWAEDELLCEWTEDEDDDEGIFTVRDKSILCVGILAWYNFRNLGVWRTILVHTLIKLWGKMGLCQKIEDWILQITIKKWKDEDEIILERLKEEDTVVLYLATFSLLESKAISADDEVFLKINKSLMRVNKDKVCKDWLSNDLGSKGISLGVGIMVGSVADLSGLSGAGAKLISFITDSIEFRKEFIEEFRAWMTLLIMNLRNENGDGVVQVFEQIVNLCLTGASTNLGAHIDIFCEEFIQVLMRRNSIAAVKTFERILLCCPSRNARVSSMIRVADRIQELDGADQHKQSLKDVLGMMITVEAKDIEHDPPFINEMKELVGSIKGYGKRMKEVIGVTPSFPVSPSSSDVCGNTGQSFSPYPLRNQSHPLSKSLHLHGIQPTRPETHCTDSQISAHIQDSSTKRRTNISKESECQGADPDWYLNTLPPGYRFCPTDEQLIVDYLIPKNLMQTVPLNKFRIGNPWSHHPEGLTGNFKFHREKEWYFFVERDNWCPKGNGPDRKAGFSGYWMVTEADKEIYRDNQKIGYKTELVFYETDRFSGHGDGQITDWIMHEYKVDKESSPSTAVDDKVGAPSSSDAHDIKFNWFLCKILTTVETENNQQQNEELATKYQCGYKENDPNIPVDYLNSFPPGYRFCPTDEELIVHYLRPKNLCENLFVNKIQLYNVYNHSPASLIESCKQGEDYFFALRKSVNRATDDGHWKATGKDKIICIGDKQIGLRTTLVFHKGSSGHAIKTEWLMYEYKEAQEDELVLCVILDTSPETVKDNRNENVMGILP